MTYDHISKEWTEVYKGVGMLFIVLHNYYHLVYPITGENQFTFTADHMVILLRDLSAQPLEVVHLFFSFLGHYGVQVFIFLSAYGLTRAYSGREVRWMPFMLRRFSRIYPTFLLAIAAHALFVVTPWNERFLWFLKAYAVKLALLSAFVPQTQLSVVGPWWFFSFIFQFYAVFPMLHRFAIRYGNPGLAVVGLGALGVTIAVNPILAPLYLNLNFTLVGHLPVICLGIAMARAEKLTIDRRILLVAVVTFILSNWTQPIWYFASVSATIVLMAALLSMSGRLTRWPSTCRFLKYCGAVSLPLFAIHGIARLPFVELANFFRSWHATLAISIPYVAASLFAAQIMLWVENAGRRWITAHTPGIASWYLRRKSPRGQ